MLTEKELYANDNNTEDPQISFERTYLKADLLSQCYNGIVENAA